MAANVQDVIMMLGDSLTEGGWEAHGIAQRLALAYKRKMDVVNRGLIGYNTNWIIPVFEQCFAKRDEQQHVPRVRLLTIWLGANDAAYPSSFLSVPLETYKANLSELIRLVQDPSSPWYSPDTHILFLTPPPVNTPQWRARQESQEPPEQLDRDNDGARKYAEAMKEVGAKSGVPVIDLWTTFWDKCGHVEERLDEWFYDGLHLNEKGYAIVFDEVMKAISDHYPELHYDNLQPVFALYDQIDLKDTRSSLRKKNAFAGSN